MQVDLEFIRDTLIECSYGVPVTFKLVAVSLVISTPLALLMAIANQHPKTLLSRILRIYISFVRSIPLIVLIFLLYHSLPIIINAIIKNIFPGFNIYDCDDMLYGYIVFTFVSIPSLSEVFRAGLLNVTKDQREAASAIGMTSFQEYTHIIIPQAVSSSLPVLCTFTTNLIKMTSLAFCMSIKEITGVARVAAADSIRYVECYLTIFVMYLVICLVVEQIFKYFEKHRKGYLANA